MRAQTPVLSDAEREHLQTIVRRATSPRRDVFRAQMILDAAGGLSNEAIAAAHQTPPATGRKGRGLFLRRRPSNTFPPIRSGGCCAGMASASSAAAAGAYRPIPVLPRRRPTWWACT